MLRISLIFLLIFIATTNYSQKRGKNALLFPELIVNDVVAIDTNYFNGYSYAKEFYSQSICKIKFSNELSLNSLLMKKITNPQFTVYMDYSPYGNVYFEKFDEIFIKADIGKLISDLGGKSDTINTYNDNGKLEKSVVNQPIDTAQLKGLLFFDNWFFNGIDFKFTKEVLAYCPIRRYLDDFGMDERWLYRKIGWFVFPKIKRGKLKRLEKRMVYLGRFEYEFSLDNKQLFGQEDENALYLEEIDSPNWNSFARQNIRNIIINRALSGKSRVLDYQTGKQLSNQEIKKNLGYEHRDITYIDPDSEEEKIQSVETEIYKEDIKSLIFIEDWFIDKETMRLKKVVKAMAPIRFYSYDGVMTKKKIAFVIYLD